MTLWEVAAGSQAKITGYSKSVESLRDRLDGLGFAIGTTVQCVRHTPFSGPRVYETTGSVFAIEKQVATEVLVETLPEAVR